MASYSDMAKYMRSTINHASVDHIQRFMADRRRNHQEPNLLELLANVAHGPEFTQSVLDLVLGILRAQYDNERDHEWAQKLCPWECRLLDSTIGSAFTRVFCTKLSISFDGCYEDIGDIGRAEQFLISFGNYAVRLGNGEPIRGGLDPARIKELVFYPDPMFTSADPGMPRDMLQKKAAGHYLLRYEEDLKEGKLLTVTPKRARIYEKLCVEGLEEDMERHFHFDRNKVFLKWIRIIDLLRFLPNLEVFRWKSDAPVVEYFISAISYFCTNLKVLEFNLDQPFDGNDYALHAWNRFYQDEPGGRLYQSKTLLENPVAKYLSEYIADTEARKPTDRLPDQCRVSLRLNLRSDAEVTLVCDTIGIYSEHVQSLIIDRSKSHKSGSIDSILELGPQNPPTSGHGFDVTHLSLISTSTTVNNYVMRSIEPDSIESLELINCEAPQVIYFPVIRKNNRLRKFKIAFQPLDEAKERAYNYWKHYILQKRLTFDFLRCGLIELDELDIRGDFGEPGLHPVEFSGLTTDLFFAIEAQAPSLVRLQVVNNNIDFSLAEIGSILYKAPKLTQLGITCRAFSYEDSEGNQVKQGLGTKGNFEGLIRILATDREPVAITILRTHYNPLDEPVYSRDGADRNITPLRTASELERIVNFYVEQNLPILHFAIFVESAPNAYGIFKAGWNEELGKNVLVNCVLQEDVHGIFETYEEFEKVNDKYIKDSGVAMPRPVNGPPARG